MLSALRETQAVTADLADDPILLNRPSVDALAQDIVRQVQVLVALDKDPVQIVGLPFEEPLRLTN
jgi:hypothetical protein